MKSWHYVKQLIEHEFWVNKDKHTCAWIAWVVNLENNHTNTILLCKIANQKWKFLVVDVCATGEEVVPVFDVVVGIFLYQGVQLLNPPYLSVCSQEGVSLPATSSRTAIFASHDLHECTMYYPMRSIRTHEFHLIHNLNFRMPFTIDQDFFASPTFQDLLERTRLGQPLHWYKTLRDYYYRPQWELYDIRIDPREEVNLAGKEDYAQVFTNLKEQLNTWQNITADPWICAPDGVLEFQGNYKAHPRCLSLENGLKDEL